MKKILINFWTIIRQRASLPAELRAHIGQFKIDGFAKKYFSEHRQGIFRRKVPVEKMLIYQKVTFI